MKNETNMTTEKKKLCKLQILRLFLFSRKKPTYVLYTDGDIFSVINFRINFLKNRDSVFKRE